MLNIDDRLIKEVSPKIGPNALSVLLAIAIHLNKKTGRCFPSHSRLMELTGMGKNTVYDALKKLKEEGILKSEQAIDTKTKKFGRRVFRLTTRFIQIFVDAADAEPLPESREPESREPESREPESREPESWETQQLNNGEHLNKLEQLNNENAPAPLKTETLRVKNESSAAAPDFGDSPRAKTPLELESGLRAFYIAHPIEWRDGVLESAGGRVYSTTAMQDIVKGFCEWGVDNGRGNDTYSRLNARFQKWVRDQKTMRRETVNTAAPSVIIPKDRVYGN